jgi:hypothetical protein
MHTDAEHARPGPERRRSPRYEIPEGRLLPIRSDSPAQAVAECFVENLSRSGCGARGFLPAKRGDTITAELEFGERSIFVDARIERVITSAQDAPRWGLAFVGTFQSRCPACGSYFATAFPPQSTDAIVDCPDCKAQVGATPLSEEEAAWYWNELGTGD